MHLWQNQAYLLPKGNRERGGKGRRNLAPTVISKSLCIPVQISSRVMGPSYEAWPRLDPPLSMWSICNLGAHASTCTTGPLDH